MSNNGEALRLPEGEGERWERAIALAQRIAELADAPRPPGPIVGTEVAAQLEHFASTAEELAHELGGLLEDPPALELLIDLLALLSDVTVRFHARMLTELGDRLPLRSEVGVDGEAPRPLAVEIAAVARRLRAVESSAEEV
jgi:hypothetical protein